jgi:hypothetical protein
MVSKIDQDRITLRNIGFKSSRTGRESHHRHDFNCATGAAGFFIRAGGPTANWKLRIGLSLDTRQGVLVLNNQEFIQSRGISNVGCRAEACTRAFACCPEGSGE